MLDASAITEDLYVGAAPEPGHYAGRFDTIVLVAEEYQPPDQAFPGVRVRRYPFDDAAEPREHDYFVAREAARAVAYDITRGRRVLVACNMGRNRSALVAALALVMLTGMSGAEACAAVRARRVDRFGTPALSNPAFRAFLRRVR